ncbi:sulfatase [Halapricum hydrolyticum]|uniref:Sulfatase-like hydrolase/transferase n=2 Tax=Halapricum hydrolyticum TaxID=2979991 RepID=A0AAE3IH09_9EURY|nr:sulfatase [Halapricum hydrolyticum]MCU4728524.1 sulfatase-like hydrolase/transferase [Halapricum hydrolyticum]
MAPEAFPMSKPNVLFLVVDSLRYDVATGNWESATPTIDRLLDEGVHFQNCFAQGISTAPSMTAILTGRHPLDYGGHWYLDDDQRTFAQVFRDGGYYTGAIHSNPYVSARRNFDRGFDHFAEDVVAFEPDEGLEGLPDKLLRLASRASRILSRTPYTPAEEVNTDILSFVDDADTPWFLWTQYMDVHGPYLGGDNFSYRNKFRAEWLWRKAAVRDPDSITEAEHEELRENYRREVEYLDSEIGNLLGELDERGHLDDTFVVLTADHGDEFYEHGRYGHGNLPYDELTHVPLVIRPPSGSDIPRGETVDDLVRCIDILPTIIDAVDAEIPTQHRERLAGKSLLPLVRGKKRDEEPVVVTEKRVRGEKHLRIGLRTTRWKYLYDGVEDERFLYNLENDPGETTDVSQTETTVAEEFETRLRERLNQIEETSENVVVPDVETDAGVEERLKALGYK